jgi:hypothetical protein
MALFSKNYTKKTELFSVLDRGTREISARRSTTTLYWPAAAIEVRSRAPLAMCCEQAGNGAGASARFAH